MPEPTKLYKTTIVIWTDYDPKDVDIEDLGRDIVLSNALCSSRGTIVTEVFPRRIRDFFFKFRNIFGTGEESG